MTPTRTIAIFAVTLCCAALLFARSPQPARAFNPISTACSVAGWFSGLAGKACNAGNTLLGLGKKLFGGHSPSSTTSKVQAAVGLAAIGAWVMGGAKVAMEETAKVLGHTTSPRLTTTWFSSTYWRMAGLAAVLTLPFLFAAAIQALTRSDLTLLLRAAFGYLPMAMLAVGIAAPLTMLLLAATDEMCSVVSAAGGNAGARFLSHVGAAAGLVSILDGSAFLAFLIGLFVAFGALVLWLELLIREAAVYIIVLMLPLAFAAFVWPARRVWATRAIELLVALILSKFAIVAVLTLGRQRPRAQCVRGTDEHDGRTRAGDPRRVRPVGGAAPRAAGGDGQRRRGSAARRVVAAATGGGSGRHRGAAGDRLGPPRWRSPRSRRRPRRRHRAHLGARRPG